MMAVGVSAAKSEAKTNNSLKEKKVDEQGGGIFFESSNPKESQLGGSYNIFEVSKMLPAAASVLMF